MALTKFGALAPALIAKFKASGDVREVTLERSTKVPIDVNQPSLGFTAEITSDKFDAAIVPINRERVDFTSVERGDRQAIFAAEDVALALKPPRSGDIITDGSTRWNIVQNIIVGPGVEDVLYKAQVRA